MKTIVITGASRGIGWELAKLFAKHHNVFCLSRTAPPELNPKGISAHEREVVNITHIQCDVADFESIKATTAQIPSVDILINNAGTGIGGSIENTSLDEAHKIVDVNLMGVFNVTKAFLPQLRQTKGRVINISSVASTFSIPYQTMYSATKVAVTAFGSGLRNELRPFGVQVMNVLPADVKTSFSAARTMNSDDGVYTSFSKNSIERMERDEQKGGLCPQGVAKRIFKLSTRKRMPPKRTIGVQHRFLTFIVRFVPQRLIDWVVFKMYGGAR